MSSTQNKINAHIFIDYIPAELRETATWEVVYYAKNPYTEKLQIKRNRVKPILPITARRKLGKQMVSNANKKLENGWNPWADKANAKHFTKFAVCKNQYLNSVKHEVKKDDKREDTLRTYKSFLDNIERFILEINIEDIFIFNFNEELILELLDHIYYDRGNSARTRNNYLGFLATFGNWLKKKKYILESPANNIDRFTEKEKIRTIIPKRDKERIFQKVSQTNTEYLTLCLVCYYCLGRRTEITKLKCIDVLIKQGILYFESTTSKNKRGKPVTIPNTLIDYLSNHLKDANDNDFLFSTNNFKPGPDRLKPKK